MNVGLDGPMLLGGMVVTKFVTSSKKRRFLSLYSHGSATTTKSKPNQMQNTWNYINE